MCRKNRGLNQSQRLGIIWLSVGLLIIVAIAIFSPKTSKSDPANNHETTADTSFLKQKEDSVYSARRNRQEIRSKGYRSHPYSRNSTAGDKYQRDSRADSTLYTTRRPSATKRPLCVELNSADTLTLQLIHGIGPAFARRIVRYRDRLGGFVDKQQLLEVYGFTPQLVEHIGPYITVDTSLVMHIDVNSAGLKELARHPYMEYYTARDIVVLRNKGVHFGSAEELRTVPSMADSSLERLMPYLTF